VRKGETGSPVVYANALVRAATDAATGDEVERAIHFLKGYTVFNVEQIEGLPAPFYAPAIAPRLDPPERIERAETFFTATGATVSHGGSRAFYRPRRTVSVLPAFEAFRDAESYYATRAHETMHWVPPMANSVETPPKPPSAAVKNVRRFNIRPRPLLDP
jgi:antirestriction protein ArdC